MYSRGAVSQDHAFLVYVLNRAQIDMGRVTHLVTLPLLCTAVLHTYFHMYWVQSVNLSKLCNLWYTSVTSTLVEVS